ncbi:MAG: hypothetical protein KKA73_24425 [Chloroflexi bacterium]|nr:hypothetical protein [Chloroflexota bacterium]MBU1750840.1 hypothetical protein [Chloroflexota bacterium]
MSKSSDQSQGVGREAKAQQADQRNANIAKPTITRGAFHFFGTVLRTGTI